MSNIVDSSSSSTGAMLWNTATMLVWRMGSLVFGLGGVIATILYFKQDSMLYFPEIGGIPRRPSQNPRRYRSPSEHQIPFESHKIECADGVTIHAWLLMREQVKNNLPTLVFFHGNAGNIGLRLPNALQMLQYLNANIFMVEYRGYGDSDSVTPSEAGLKLDAQAALRFILKNDKIDASKIFLFGRSLGGAVAVDLAQYAEQHQLPLAGVIVENTFKSISEMVDHMMPYIAPLKALVLRMRWDSSSIVPHLQLPVLYLAGAKDDLVPHSHMLQLHKSTTRSRLNKIHIIRDGTHNETWMQGGQEYWDAIRSFLAAAIDSSNDASATVSSTINSSENMPTLDVATGSSSIPIMPSRILGIARESLRESSASMETPGKKEL
jgi:pimeloyl-ACP methyl ester carboxylesterase